MACAGPLARAAAAENCIPPVSTVAARLKGVIDGDTLRLEDGSKVRLIGVNTPELGRDTRPPEPLGPEAKAAVKTFFGADRELRLVFGTRQRDRYGRLLAHVFSIDGRSLEAYLLERGLAFHIAFPPNLALADCLQEVELRARRRGLGVWVEPYWRPLIASRLSATAGSGVHGGFRLIRGRVTGVTENKHWWVNMDGPLVLRVSRSAPGGWTVGELRNLVGQTVEVRGWLVDRTYQGSGSGSRYAGWRLDLRSKYSLSEQY